MRSNSKVRYSVDDYLKDKKAVSPLGSTQEDTRYRRDGNKFSSPAVYVTTPSVDQPASLPAHGRYGATVLLPSSDGSTGLSYVYSPSGEAPSAVDVTKFYLEEARRRVYDVLNRRFSYEPAQSPLYTILQQQHEREAERAAGLAYARAVANTGGYGSSYASLVSEVARRRVMEGMSEQEATLYKAAREAFLSERASAVEWYERAKALYGDAVDIADYEWMQTILQKEEGA